MNRNRLRLIIKVRDGVSLSGPEAYFLVEDLIAQRFLEEQLYHLFTLYHLY